MSKPEPRLQSKLLAWLLGPLTALLLLDTGIAYWNSVRFSNLAYDRALHEIGREIVLHVRLDARPEGPRPRLDLSEAAANILLRDPEDLLFYRVFDSDGAVLGGDADLPPPPPLSPPLSPEAKPLFYGAELRGRPVRMMVAWMPPPTGTGAVGIRIR